MTRTTETEHALMSSGGDEVIRGVVFGTREELFRGVVSAIHQDSTTNEIYSLDLTSITGGNDPTDCYPGMTLDIGTTAGAHDVGQVRIRFYGGDSNTVTIAGTSFAELPVEVGHHVTAILEFLPWRIAKRFVETLDMSGNITAVDVYFDYDLAFSSGSHPFPPKCNISAGHNADGSIKEVLPFGWEDTPGCGYRTQHLSILDSVVHNPGGSLGTPLWDLGDCIILGGGTVFDDEIDVQIPVGFRYIHMLLPDSYGRQDLMFRHMPLWCDSKPEPQFVLYNFNVTSDETQDGRELQLEFFGNADEAAETVIPKRSLACYFETPGWADGDTPPESYRQQVMGWITDDNPRLKLEESTYGIRIGGTAAWKKAFRAFSVTLLDTGSTPTTWTEMQHITIDRALDFSLNSNDTLRSLVNVYYSGYTAEVATVTLAEGDCWSQLTDCASKGALAVVGCDSLGHIHIKRPYWGLSADQQTAILEAISITNADWPHENGFELPTLFLKPVGSVKGAGEVWVSGDRAVYASQAPGLRESYGTGTADVNSWLQEPTPQADLNRLTGRWFWHSVLQRPTLTLILLGNLDVVEPCWQQPILITWTGDTIRGETLSSTAFLVKSISIAHTNAPDESTPPKRITWTLEQIVSGDDGETAPVDKQMAGVTPPVDTTCDLTAGFTSAISGCAVTFTDTSTGDLIVGWLWDFGDGSGFSELQNPVYGYAESGTYTVTLVVFSDCGTVATVSHTVTITAETVVANFDAVASSGVVTFSDLSTADSGIVKWAWDFGNGEKAVVQNPTYDFGGISDTYNVTLTVTSACGVTDSMTLQVSPSTGLVPIAAYDFISGVGITPITTPATSGTVTAGTFDTSGEGLSTANSLKHIDPGSGSEGNSFSVVPPTGDTWLSVTEVRYHFKQDFPHGAWEGNNWFYVDAKVYGPHDPGGVTIYSNLFENVYNGQMTYYTMIIPIDYVYEVTQIDIHNRWEHVGFPFDNAPGSYLADMTVYGTKAT